MKNNGNHQNDGKINQRQQQQQRTKIMIHSDDNGGAGGGGAKAATPIGQVGVKIPDGKQQLGNSGREEEKRQDKWIEDLPTLPIPDIEKTMERYLDGLEPVIQSTLQMEQTRLIVKDFLYGNDNNLDDDSEGKRLQKLLIEYAKQTDNWSTDFWLDDMYLTNPSPLLINSNPFFLLPRQTFRRTSDLINFAAYFTKFALIFKEQIDNQTLKQDTMRGRKLCMKTYQHFFTACRIPGEDKDELYIHKHQPGSCQHFIVAAFNQFTVVYLEQSTTIPSIDELEQCLSNIWNRSKIPLQFQQPNIGILTTENRKIWAKIRTELIEDKTNVESIHLIETSLFILCLDDFILPKTNQRSGYRNSIQIAKMDQSYMSTMLLHGGGSQIHTANRWWDKFLQIIVSKEGICGCIMEHSASEGITMINFLKKFLNFYQQNYHPSSATSTTSSSATIIDANHGQDDLLKQSTTTTTTILKSLPLRWNITLDLDKHIKQAEKHADKSINDLDFYVLKFNEYGSDFIKQQKISPDAYIQLSLQLTFFKLHRYIVSTYESCSIRHFQNGRVDTIRSSTKEARDWAKSMCPQPTSTLTTTTTTTTSNNLIVEDVEEDQKIKLFKRAIQKQVEIMHYTMNGHGPENHLRALRELSKKNFNTIPAIFREKSFGEYGNYRLSTSQLPTDIDIIIGYGPVVPDGYGCAYTPKKDHIIFCVSSFYSSDETSSDFFALSLEGSLLQMRELCLRMNANGSSATFSARTPDI